MCVCVCVHLCMICCAVCKLKFNRWLLKHECNTCFQIFLNYEFMNCHRVDSKPGTQGLSPSAMLGFAIFSAEAGNRTRVSTFSRREMYGNAIFTAFTKQSFLTLTAT